MVNIFTQKHMMTGVLYKTMSDLSGSSNTYFQRQR